MKKSFVLSILVLLAILLSACLSSESVLTRNRQTPPESIEATLAAQLTELVEQEEANEIAQLASQTQIVQAAYQTAMAEVTEYALQTEVARPAVKETLDLFTQVAPTGTPMPADNQALPVVESATPLLSTPIPVAPACERAALVSDVSIPDWTNLERGQPFTKTWRIKNVGDCAWDAGYWLVFDSGEVMDGPAQQPIGVSVQPGEEFLLDLNLVAPPQPGKYTSFWKLRDLSGATFGTGSDGNDPLWVSINVETPNIVKLDATSNFCQAAWTNVLGSLDCPSSPRSQAGSMSVEEAPRFEGGYRDDEPTLVMIPNDGPGGSISARYPAFQVEAGDHFLSMIGCMMNKEACNITFELGYYANGSPLQPLGSWQQTYDGIYEKINVDLSALAGQMVELVLTVKSNNGTSIDNAGFWLTPVVMR